MESNVLTAEFPRAAFLEPPTISRRQAGRRTAIQVAHEFETAPERVFDAWLDPKVAGRWLFATATRPMTRVAIDPRVGGAFRFVDRNDGERIEHAGVYVEIARPRRLVFTLSQENEPPHTRVAVEIVARHAGCELTLAHEKVPADRAMRTENRWTGMLYGLGLLLDAGTG